MIIKLLICALCLQGSDYEALGSEAAVECGAGIVEHPPVKETKLQDTLLSESAGNNPLIVSLPLLTGIAGYVDIDICLVVCLQDIWKSCEWILRSYCVEPLEARNT